MLASQTHDGDLRVWSVAKSFNAEDPAKVVRVLKKSENLLTGPNWMSWSKNGRIIQFAESYVTPFQEPSTGHHPSIRYADRGDRETLSWDVRTKHVTNDPIPTLEQVKGIAVYGPGATLFTIGPNNTVQQFDLNSPAIIVANVQHPANLLPPSPPNSIEETGGDRSAHSATTINTSESESSIPVDMVGVSESDEDHLSPFARLTQRPPTDSGNEMSYDSASPISSRSGVSSVSKSSAGSRTPARQAGAGSLRSRGMTEHTYISAGSSLHSTTVGHKRETDNYSMGYSLGTTSLSSIPSSRGRHRPSRLRNEVPRSPEDNKVHDLFKYTRTRLSDIPYKHPMPTDISRLTNDHLRRQMLSTIFGWHKEVEDLIRDEMSRYAASSPNRILLAKWLGDIDHNILAASSENMTSSDWMLLALSGIGNHASQTKLGQAYVQRLLEGGDIHAAVTIMLGMGDENDAIEVYVSHKRYMEALILTCKVFPGVWERQVAIIRKWGEWAVQHGQQQLAIRCFACTDQESTEPWTSPSAAQLNFQSVNPSIPEVLSPPLSPPGLQRGPQRSVAKTSALKLITSFGDQSQRSKFYSQGDGGQTPIAAGVTPIAESAVSPVASFEATTAFIRPSNNSRFNTPVSARSRGRLPSIGEVPSDLKRDGLISADGTASTQGDSHRTHVRMSSLDQDNLAVGISLQRAATASPMMMRDQFQKAARGTDVDALPPPDKAVMAKLQQTQASRRNGSRERIPRGMNLQLGSVDVPEPVEATSPEQSVTSSTRFHWPRRHGPGSVASSLTSTSSAGRSLRQNVRIRDDYIHSLDAAQHYSRHNRSRHRSKEGGRDSSQGRNASQERKTKSREASEERGRASTRSWTKPKRSPTSPVPMSPEDLANLSTPRFLESGEPVTVRKVSSKVKPSSRTSSRGSRGSRRKSIDGKHRPPQLELRGRSNIREASTQRSPSSPLPLSATVPFYQGSEDEDDFEKAKQSQEMFRARHSRNSSRGVSSPIVTKQERSRSRRREAAEAVDILPALPHTSRAGSTEHAGDLKAMKDERQRKKDQAARELEERRKSLAKRPQAPSIPQPSEFSPALRIGVETADQPPAPEDLPPRSATEPPKSMYARNGPYIGLPATPKAMRLILGAEQTNNGSVELPDVPPIPATFAQRHSPRLPPDTSGEQEPEKEAVPELLTLLAPTVYQPPTRPAIARSMSAPIPDDVPPKDYGRKSSTGEVRGIDEIMRGSRRGSHDDQKPQRTPALPPPPPAPPVLKELQHLAIPPPPPPAPLPHMRGSREAGALGSGMIEIVMDEDEPAAAANDAVVSALSPQLPPGSQGHSRGRSIGDNSSMGGRFSKATERLRSASRGRKDAARKAQTHQAEAPYESVPSIAHHLKSPVSTVPPPVNFDTDVLRSPVEGKGKFPSTGLHRSEMI